MTNKDTLADLISKYESLVKDFKDLYEKWTASMYWVYRAYEQVIKDLKQLQAEQPKQEADIDKIHDIADNWIKALENKNTLTVYNTIRYLENIATKHLTQKTTVPKDGEMVEISKSERNTRRYCPKCNERIEYMDKYCCGCWVKFKRID